jgi:hypothetical protein
MSGRAWPPNMVRDAILTGGMKIKWRRPPVPPRPPYSGRSGRLERATATDTPLPHRFKFGSTWVSVIAYPGHRRGHRGMRDTSSAFGRNFPRIARFKSVRSGRWFSSAYTARSHLVVGFPHDNRFHSIGPRRLAAGTMAGPGGAHADRQRALGLPMLIHRIEKVVPVREWPSLPSCCRVCPIQRQQPYR